ncbi:MAG: CoA-transferase [Geminicoccaceae bacterium]
MTATPAELAALIPDGAVLALAPDYSGCSLATVRELIRKGAKRLRLVGLPQLGLQADLLIATGCVAGIETAAISLGELGLAPAFDRAWRAGSVSVTESTCPAIHAGLTAAEKGVSHLPLAGVLGSDLIALRPDWQVGPDPFTGEPGLLVPAIRPDFLLFHAAVADRSGNVWIGVRRELMLAAHAARRTLATVEEVAGHDLLADDLWAAGTIPALYVEQVATASGGAAPVGLRGRYGPDRAWLASYAEAARDPASCKAFLDAWLRDG